MVKVKFNYALNAYNAFEIDIDYDTAFTLVSPFLEGLNNRPLIDPNMDCMHLKDFPLSFCSQSPNWKGDISWVSAASKEAFTFFEQCFEKLEIERKTQEVAELDFPLMMYSGFFVVRSYGEDTHFHLDFDDTCDNQAFTLMLPIQLDEKSESGHLLYKDVFFADQKYTYTKGKAITFGSRFIHSTEPFRSTKKFIFLCFTYGTTNADKWDAIKTTVTKQGISYKSYDGSVIVRDKTFERYF